MKNHIFIKVKLICSINIKKNHYQNNKLLNYKKIIQKILNKNNQIENNHYKMIKIK